LRWTDGHGPTLSTSWRRVHMVHVVHYVHTVDCQCGAPHLALAKGPCLRYHRRMPPDTYAEPPHTYVGCCGAYCKTCKPFREGFCKGCKLGYTTGERELTKAKCRIKVCCMGRGYQSCADCSELDTCDIMHSFHDKSGYKYRKYKESITFICQHGYAEYIRQADTWTNAYGKFHPPGA